MAANPIAAQYKSAIDETFKRLMTQAGLTDAVASSLSLFDLLNSGTVGDGGGGAAFELGEFDANPGEAEGGSVVDGVFSLQSASATLPGLVNTADQTFSGFKYFEDDAGADNLYATLSVFCPAIDADAGFAITSVPLTLRGFPETNLAGFTNVVIDTTATLTGTSKLLSLKNNTVEKLFVDKDGILSSATGSSLTFKSNVTNSGSNVAFILDSVALTGSTALLSIRNNGTEQLYMSRAGQFRIQQSTGSVSAPSFGDLQGVFRFTPNTFSANDGNDYKGRAADGATAVSHKFGGTVALTTAGAKIAGFYNDAGLLTSLKASIDKDGVYENHTTGGGIVLKSPDGTRYLITVANGGAISATAL